MGEESGGGAGAVARFKCQRAARCPSVSSVQVTAKRRFNPSEVEEQREAFNAHGVETRERPSIARKALA